MAIQLLPAGSSRTRRAGLMATVVSGALCFAGGNAKAALVFDIFQDGTGVTVTASGDFKFAGSPSTPFGSLDAELIPIGNLIVVGPQLLQPNWSLLAVNATASPGSALGPGTGTIPTTTTGKTFGFAGGATGANVFFPTTYSSGSPLAGSMFFSGATLASLGLTPGTYVWQTESGGTNDSITVNIPDPQAVPGPLPLFGAAAGFTWSRRLRSRIGRSQRAAHQINGSVASRSFR